MGVTTISPDGSVVGPNWTNQGGAASPEASQADSLDSTYMAHAALLTVPAINSIVLASTGGTLAAGTTPAYRVSAINSIGETLASTEFSRLIPTALATPVISSSSTATTGGSLVAGTYAGRISAINAIGETLASAEVSQVVPAGTATNTVTYNWNVVAGATGYKYYGRTVGGELFVATLGAVTTYTDTGAITPAGALPASNTSATNTNTATPTWVAVPYATGYKVYGRGSGAELLMATVGAVTSWTDTGSITPAGALPASDTSFTAPIAAKDRITFSLANPTIPTLAQVRSVRVYSRCAAPNAPDSDCKRFLQLEADSSGTTTEAFVDTLFPTASISDRFSGQIAVAPDSVAWDSGRLNRLRVTYEIDSSKGNYDTQLYKSYVEVTYNEAPVVAVTAPTGTVTNGQPPIAWTYTDPEGDPQQLYSLAIFTSAVYGGGGFDPNTSSAVWRLTDVPSSTLTRNCDVVLANGVYRVYVKAADLGSNNRYGAWAYRGFTVTVGTVPGVPTISASRTGTFTTILLTATGAGTTAFQVQSSPDNVTFTDIRTSPVALAGSPTTTSDYESPGVTYYRARAIDATDVSLSAYSASVTSTIGSADWMLIDPLNPTTFLLLAVVGSQATSNTGTSDIDVASQKTEDKAFYSPLGRSKKVAVSDVIRGEQSTIAIEFVSSVDWQTFEFMRGLQRTLLLQRGWTGEQWYIQFDTVRTVDLFNNYPAYRQVTIAYVEVDRP